MAMDAILTTIADRGRAIVDIDREAGGNKLNSRLLHNFILNPSTLASANPFCRGSGRWGVFRYIEIMPLERQTAPSWWGCLFVVCFAGKKPPERDFFVPVRTDLV